MDEILIDISSSHPDEEFIADVYEQLTNELKKIESLDKFSILRVTVKLTTYPSNT
jgi:hypothetical protein